MRLLKILINLFSIKKQLNLNTDSERLEWITKYSKLGTVEINKPSYRRNFELIFYPSSDNKVIYKFLGNNLRKVLDVASNDKELKLLFINGNDEKIINKEKNDVVINLPIRPHIGNKVCIANDTFLSDTLYENIVVNFKD